MILTDGRIEIIADKVCDLVYKTVDEYVKEYQPTKNIEPCDICPFTSFCKIGKTGFTEFFKQEINK